MTPAWPVGELPSHRGAITAIDVHAAPAGDARDAMIHRWCQAVWSAYAGSRECVVTLVQRRGLVPDATRQGSAATGEKTR